MKKLILFITCIIIANVLSGQERYFDERYISTMSFLNPVLVNPGATGYEGEHHILLNYRNEWASFPGSAKSVILSYDGPIAEGLGVGALFLSDSNGSLNTTKFQGSIAYTLDTPTNVLGFGLAAEFIQHGLNADALSGPIIDRNDPTVNNRLDGANFFDVSFGVQGMYNGVLSYGLSLPSLVSSQINDNSGTIDDHEIGYIFNVGYKFDQLDSGISLEPSLWVKKLNNVPFHADINLLGRFLEDKLRGGLSYRVGADEKLGFLIGFSVNTLNFTYAYNASRHDFQQYNNGSHELSVRFDIGKVMKNGFGEDDLMEDKMMEN
jgi:type IX secretion system PorP/SprF family membrane protein